MTPRDFLNKMIERTKQLIPTCTTLEDLESRLAYEFEMTEEEMREIYMPTIYEYL